LVNIGILLKQHDNIRKPGDMEKVDQAEISLMEAEKKLW
jgi:hypothetical protein